MKRGVQYSRLVAMAAIVALGLGMFGMQGMAGQALVPKSGQMICVDCGSSTPGGTTDVNCNGYHDFQCAAVTDDLGNKVQVWCIDKSFYALLYTPMGGNQRFVGRCPFGGGRNAVSLFVQTDASGKPDSDGNGKYDHIQGAVWISHDGPEPPNYVDDEGLDPTDPGHAYDRWVYTYLALSINDVKQENLECSAYKGSVCATAKSQTKTPKEGCFSYIDLLPNPYSGDDDMAFISTSMTFPADVEVLEPFVLSVAHEEVVIDPAGEIWIGDFLRLLVDVIRENPYLTELVGLEPELRFDEEQQRHVVDFPCVDPQEFAILKADPRMGLLAPVAGLEAFYDSERREIALNWDLQEELDTIVIWRNGNRITDYLPGNLNYFVDDFRSSPLDFLLQERPPRGMYTYTVFGIRDGVYSIAAQVEVDP